MKILETLRSSLNRNHAAERERHAPEQAVRSRLTAAGILCKLLIGAGGLVAQVFRARKQRRRQLGISLGHTAVAHIDMDAAEAARGGEDRLTDDEALTLAPLDIPQALQTQ